MVEHASTFGVPIGVLINCLPCHEMTASGNYDPIETCILRNVFEYLLFLLLQVRPSATLFSPIV